eukprot:2227684-Pyramimonas_sp.AAC.1
MRKRTFLGYSFFCSIGGHVGPTPQGPRGPQESSKTASRERRAAQESSKTARESPLRARGSHRRTPT